mmetsp:Transcript_14247/g.49540  ORF Transcript_14247/g.49540 Transcript_14247/m.49540 type:complete len:327 (-) Transcript_14247:604-1584(-)
MSLAPDVDPTENRKSATPLPPGSRKPTHDALTRSAHMRHAMSSRGSVPSETVPATGGVVSMTRPLETAVVVQPTPSVARTTAYTLVPSARDSEPIVAVASASTPSPAPSTRPGTLTAVKGMTSGDAMSAAVLSDAMPTSKPATPLSAAPSTKAVQPTVICVVSDDATRARAALVAGVYTTPCVGGKRSVCTPSDDSCALRPTPSTTRTVAYRKAPVRSHRPSTVAQPAAISSALTRWKGASCTPPTVVPIATCTDATPLPPAPPSCTPVQQTLSDSRAVCQSTSTPASGPSVTVAGASGGVRSTAMPSLVPTSDTRPSVLTARTWA